MRGRGSEGRGGGGVGGSEDSAEGGVNVLCLPVEAAESCVFLTVEHLFNC